MKLCLPEWNVQCLHHKSGGLLHTEYFSRLTTFKILKCTDNVKHCMDILFVYISLQIYLCCKSRTWIMLYSTVYIMSFIGSDCKYIEQTSVKSFVQCSFCC